MTATPERGGRKPAGPMWSGAEGAATERTRLAWRRTALASTVVALLTVRLAARARWQALDAVAVGLAALAWIAHMWLIQRRIQAMAEGEPTMIGRTLVATALVVIAFAVLGLVLVISAI